MANSILANFSIDYQVNLDRLKIIMARTVTKSAKSFLIEEYIQRLEQGSALLDDSPQNLVEVVGILKSYGVVLDAYSINLNYIADTQFLKLFPLFKYFNGKVNAETIAKFIAHNRINYEYAEYCMKSMFWHGGGGVDGYLDTPEFAAETERLIKAYYKYNPLMLTLHKIFPDFLPEQMRQMAYYSALGQFWRVMSDIFINLSDRYDEGKIKSIPDVVQFILDGLVADAARPITYTVQVRDEEYHILPKSGLTFLMDTGVPYVEAIFFRGTPFTGTVSYNAQAYEIPYDPGMFSYGALYADPLPVGGAGIPPTLLMQDMRHFLPDYLRQLYKTNSVRGTGDIRVQICESFQKSMFCVTTAAVKGLAPHPLDTNEPEEKLANHKYLTGWLNRILESQVLKINSQTKHHSSLARS